MDFEGYQEWTDKTWVGENDPTRIALGLVGETGEIAEKVKKHLRGDEDHQGDQFKVDMTSELGDVLYYLARLAKSLDVSLDQVAKLNKDKLESRLDRDKIQGSGDDR